MKGMVLHDVFYMPGVLVKLPGNGLYDVHKILILSSAETTGSLR